MRVTLESCGPMRKNKHELTFELIITTRLIASANQEWDKAATCARMLIRVCTSNRELHHHQLAAFLFMTQHLCTKSSDDGIEVDDGLLDRDIKHNLQKTLCLRRQEDLDMDMSSKFALKCAERVCDEGESLLLPGLVSTCVHTIVCTQRPL